MESSRQSRTALALLTSLFSLFLSLSCCCLPSRPLRKGALMPPHCHILFEVKLSAPQRTSVSSADGGDFGPTYTGSPCCQSSIFRPSLCPNPVFYWYSKWFHPNSGTVSELKGVQHGAHLGTDGDRVFHRTGTFSRVRLRLKMCVTTPQSLILHNLLHVILTRAKTMWPIGNTRKDK